MTIRTLFSPKIDRILLAATIVALIAIAFCRLGTGEIKSWDEALYLVRAQAIEQHGSWLDQTKYALGGLYSSSHPPLGIWAFTASREIFGHSTFASRLPSALAYLISLAGLYLLLRSELKREEALIGAVSLACAQTYLLYAHRAQLDAMLLAWIALSAFLFVRSVKHNATWLTVLSGLTFVGALLTKFGLGLTVLPFIITYSLLNREIKRSLIFCAMSVVVALPWYILMYARHQDFGLHVEQSALSHLFDSLRAKPWYYYLNQCVVNIPLIVPAATSLILNKKRASYSHRALLLSAIVWFGSALLLLELMSTQMAHYALLLYTPLAMIVALAVNEFGERGWKQWLLGTSALLAFSWSLSEQIRLWVRHRLDWNHIIIPSSGILIVIAALGFFLIVVNIFLKRKSVLLTSIGLFLVTIQICRLLSYSHSLDVDGAQAVLIKLKQVHPAAVAIEAMPSSIVSLPQLRYYANELGIPASTLHWFEMNNPQVGNEQAAIIECGVDRLTAHSAEADRMLEQTRAILASQFLRRMQTNSYELYY